MSVWWSPLGQTLKPLEGVVDEDPVLVAAPGRLATTVEIVVHRLAIVTAPIGIALTHTRDLEVHLREVIKVGGVINGLDLNRCRGGTLANMLPVNAGKEAQGLDVIQGLDPVRVLRAESREVGQRKFSFCSGSK